MFKTKNIMKKYIFVVLLLASAMTASAQTWKNVTYPFRMTSIDGESVSLQAWMDSGYYVVSISLPCGAGRAGACIPQA